MKRPKYIEAMIVNTDAMDLSDEANVAIHLPSNPNLTQMFHDALKKVVDAAKEADEKVTVKKLAAAAFDVVDDHLDEFETVISFDSPSERFTFDPIGAPESVSYQLERALFLKGDCVAIIKLEDLTRLIEAAERPDCDEVHLVVEEAAS